MTLAAVYLPPLSGQTEPANGASPNAVVDARAFAGADAGAKIAAAIAALPSTGGTVDARGLTGAQTISYDIFSAVTVPVTLDLGAAQFTFSVNTTIPKNFQLNFAQGGQFIAASTKTLTINGSVEAPNAQIFSGNVVLGHLASHANVTWFGAIGDGSTDSTSAFNAAITALAGGGTLDVTVGTYKLTTVNFNVPELVLRGLDNYSTILQETGTGPLFNVTQGGIVEGFNIGRATGNASTITDTVYVNAGNFTLRHNQFSGSSTDDVRIVGGTRVTIEDCSFNQTNGATSAILVPNAGPTVIRIRNNDFYGYLTALDFEGGDGSLVEGNDFSINPTSGTPVAAKYAFGLGHVFLGNWVEYNPPMFAINIGPPVSGNTNVLAMGTRIGGTSSTLSANYVEYTGGGSASMILILDLNGAGTFAPRLSLKGAFSGPVNSVAFSATPTFDASLGNTQTITLTANVTSSTLSNCAAGEWLVFDIIENSTGGFTFIWPTNIKGVGTISTTANAHNRQMFYCDGTNAWATSAMQSGS